MDFQLIDVGFSHTVPAKDIVAVVDPESAPIRRIVDEARDRHQLEDVTEGRTVRSVVLAERLTGWNDRPSAKPSASSLPSNASIQPEKAPLRHGFKQVILSAILPETVINRFVFRPINRQSHLSSTESLALMDIKLINIGFGNIVCANRVVAIVSPESAPIKRIISDARERGQLVDATYGRRTRAVIVTDVGHIILSSIQPETVANRFVVNRDPGT